MAESYIDYVYLLFHSHDQGAGEDHKLIGIYRNEVAAREAWQRASKRPGFRECLDGFQIDRYELGADYWTEGYVTQDPERK